MTEQQFEDFAKRWPEIFQKSGDFELSAGPGWISLLDTLFGLLSYDLESKKRRLKYALENPTAKMLESTDSLKALVDQAREDLPRIVQVKEKFGTLRFYTGTAVSTEMSAYIQFAESMSGKICETCGSPGTVRTGGWLKTLCDNHMRDEDKPGEILKEKKFTDVFED
jgi:hypothetical protein